VGKVEAGPGANGLAGGARGAGPAGPSAALPDLPEIPGTGARICVGSDRPREGFVTVSRGALGASAGSGGQAGAPAKQTGDAPTRPGAQRATALSHSAWSVGRSCPRASG